MNNIPLLTPKSALTRQGVAVFNSQTSGLEDAPEANVFVLKMSAEKPAAATAHFVREKGLCKQFVLKCIRKPW